jgi:Tfp pilus assembly protein PilF
VVRPTHIWHRFSELSRDGDQRQRLARRSTENSEAYQLYLKGRYEWNKRTPDGLKKAADYFQQAVNADPNYALAYSGLADAYVLLSNYQVLPPQEVKPKAEAAARRAVQMDDSVAEAHTSLASAVLDSDLDWTGAEREYKRAMALNPRNAWRGDRFIHSSSGGNSNVDHASS